MCCCKKSECWIEHLADNESGHSDDARGDGTAESSDDSSDDGSTRHDTRMPASKRRRARDKPDQDEYLHSPAPALRSSDHNLDD